MGGEAFAFVSCCCWCVCVCVRVIHCSPVLLQYSGARRTNSLHSCDAASFGWMGSTANAGAGPLWVLHRASTKTTKTEPSVRGTVGRDGGEWWQVLFKLWKSSVGVKLQQQPGLQCCSEWSCLFGRGRFKTLCQIADCKKGCFGMFWSYLMFGGMELQG